MVKTKVTKRLKPKRGLQPNFYPDGKVLADSNITKYIFRIVQVFLFWSVIYAAYDGAEKGAGDFIERVIQGPYHFWFLKMLIGLYISVPLLKAIVTNKKLELYFIGLSLVTAFIIPMLFPLLGFVSEETRAFVEKFYDGFGIKIAMGYAGYFVLGHYLFNNDFSAKAKKMAYLSGIVSVLAVCALTSYISGRMGSPYSFLYGNFNVFTLFEAVALFLVIKGTSLDSKYHAFLISASKLSLGVYIIHPLAMTIFRDLWKLDSATLNPIFFIPLLSIMVFGICFVISFVLIRIPFIKKFLI